MRIGKLPPLPENPEDLWCPFDALEPDDVLPMLEYKGSCDNCGTGSFPEEFLAIYKHDLGKYHVFVPAEDVRCLTCQANIRTVAVLCHSITIDVTEEFNRGV